MLFSHEVPVSLLEESKEFNDYDYSLLHLMDIPEYKQFYKDMAPVREQYMDNSAYEYQFIEGGFNIDNFITKINIINPSHVVVPDVIGDTDSTIQAFKDFNLLKIPPAVKLIGVIQGQTFDQLHRCYDFMRDRCDVIAIVFHSPAYKSLAKDIATANALGRMKFINELIDRGVVRENSLHLLGMSIPVELELYEHELKYIKSIDTANPFQYAMTTGQYPEDINDVNSKPEYVLTSEVVANTSISEVKKEHFFENMARFHNLFKEEK